MMRTSLPRDKFIKDSLSDFKYCLFCIMEMLYKVYAFDTINRVLVLKAVHEGLELGYTGEQDTYTIWEVMVMREPL